MATEHYIGVDLGGTQIKLALSDAQGEILAGHVIDTQSESGPESILDTIATEARKLSEACGVQPHSMGFAIPGTLDIEKGKTLFLPNLSGNWRNIPVKQIVEEKLGCPVYILNDVRAATLGELLFGRGREVQSMVFISIGTGLGAGIVLDGQLRLGAIGSAGELGHIVVQPGGRPCGCGQQGCLETLVSGPALIAEGVRLLLSGQAPKLHEIVGGDAGKVTPITLGQAANAGEVTSLHVIQRMAQNLALAINNLILTIHPELVVIGGGVAGLGDLLFFPLRQAVKAGESMIPINGLRIEPSAMGDKMGVMGAVAVAMEGERIQLRP